MRRSLSIVIILSVVALLSGCIISTTPKDNPVVLLPGQAKTFTINVFPQPAKYAWYVGGNVVPGATGNSLVYIIKELTMPGLGNWQFTPPLLDDFQLPRPGTVWSRGFAFLGSPSSRLPWRTKT